MKWSIVTDSSCDLDQTYNLNNINFYKVPFSITIGENNYKDTAQLDKRSFVDNMIHSEKFGQTACPSPGAWYDKFTDADCIIAITISSKLSGSFNSAQTAKEMVLEEYPDKHIYVLDSMSAGAGLSLLVLKAAELINAGLEFKNIIDKIETYVKQMHTTFVLSSFDNLTKSGRIPKIAGFLAGKLNLQGIGIAEKGMIELKKKARGYRKSINYLLDDMKSSPLMDEKIMISHCQNQEIAEKLRDEINKIWNNKNVIISEMSGLCSFYAEYKGIIVSYL